MARECRSPPIALPLCQLFYVNAIRQVLPNACFSSLCCLFWVRQCHQLTNNKQHTSTYMINEAPTIVFTVRFLTRIVHNDTRRQRTSLNNIQTYIHAKQMAKHVSSGCLTDELAMTYNSQFMSSYESTIFNDYYNGHRQAYVYCTFAKLQQLHYQTAPNKISRAGVSFHALRRRKSSPTCRQLKSIRPY